MPTCTSHGGPRWAHPLCVFRSLVSLSASPAASFDGSPATGQNSPSPWQPVFTWTRLPLPLVHLRRNLPCRTCHCRSWQPRASFRPVLARGCRPFFLARSAASPSHCSHSATCFSLSVTIRVLVSMIVTWARSYSVAVSTVQSCELNASLAVSLPPPALCRGEIRNSVNDARPEN